MRASLAIPRPSKSFWVVDGFQLEVVEDFISFIVIYVDKYAKDPCFVMQFNKHIE